MKKTKIFIMDYNPEFLEMVKTDLEKEESNHGVLGIFALSVCWSDTF